MPLLLFGHRGAAGESPENTMVGFAHAFNNARVRCFELDVHLTKDGKLAVIHDPTIDRVTNGSGKIIDYTYEQLRQFEVKHPKGGVGTIPLLSDVLDTYALHIEHFQIEIKFDQPEILAEVASLVVAMIEHYGIAGKSVVTSFEPKALEYVRRCDGSQRCGLISFEYTAETLQRAIDLGCFNVCIPVKTINGKELTEIAHAKGLQSTGWLGNSHHEVDTLLSWGVQSITTDYPTKIREYLVDTLHVHVT